VAPNPSNNSATDTATVLQSADLDVSKSVDNAAPLVGQQVNFTVGVTNHGPSNATAVAVNDLLPTSLSFVNATPSQGSYSAATGQWTVGAMAAGATANLVFSAAVQQTGSILNTAMVTATEPDPKGTPRNK